MSTRCAPQPTGGTRDEPKRPLRPGRDDARGSRAAVPHPPVSRPAPEVALVTGGAGFVGLHRVERLVAEVADARVISVDNYFTGSVANHVDDERVQYITASSLDINRIWDRRRLPSP